jgi:hypothetical protein
LSVGSSVLATSPSQAHLARVSTLSSPDTWSGIRSVIHDAPAEGPVTTRRGLPVAFRLPALASRAIPIPLGEFSFPHSRPTGHPSRRRTPSGLPRFTRARYDRGGCLLYPGDGGALPAECRPRPAPAASQRPAPTPRQHFIPSAGPALRDINEGSRDSPVRPAPGPWPSDGTRTLRRSSELHTPPLPATHVRAGPGIEHAPETHTAETKSALLSASSLASCNLVSQRQMRTFVIAR